MSAFPIFKVKYKVKNTIYVFLGSQTNESNNTSNNSFSERELTDIQKNDTKVEYINESIHLDDSIGVIKLKIFKALSSSSSSSSDLSIEEMYLYCLTKEVLNPVTVYQNLTQKDKLPLTTPILNQLLLNMYDENGNLGPDSLTTDTKTQYTFDDILKLNLQNSQYLISKPLGQKTNNFSFIADPFLATTTNDLMKFESNNGNLLLDTGTEIFENTIYLCIADDFIKDNDDKVIPKYFPLFVSSSLSSTLKEETTRLLANAERNFKAVDMFYDIYKEEKGKGKGKETNAKSIGIKYLKVLIYPEFKIKIPIDVIFKLIHATEEFPLIKYNPESRQENIYRLFAPNRTADGKKIPYLQKTAIFKLMKAMGKTKSVSVYTNITYNAQKIYMACEFDENCVMTVYPFDEFVTPFRQENIDEIIGQTINPLIAQISPFFEQSGLTIPLFSSLQMPNVDIRLMKYQMVYDITKPIKINELNGCISSVFVVESVSPLVQLRYKRVSNFNKHDSQEAFIIEKIDQGVKLDELIKELLAQFNDLTEEGAMDLIQKLRSEMEVTRGANKRKSLMTKINPGFKTTMNVDKVNSELTVVVDGINNIQYLDTIPIYIDSIVRITQDPKSLPKNVKAICSNKEEVVDVEFLNQGFDRGQGQSVDDSAVYYDSSSSDEGQGPNEENVDELLDILGLDDEDEDTKQSDTQGSRSSLPGSPPSGLSAFGENKGSETRGGKKTTTNSSPSESEISGLARKNESPKNTVKDITGMNLTYPNPFSQKLQERMPQLFAKSEGEKFDLYSRMCPFSMENRRQPIILTKGEKDKMIQENKGEIDEEADFIEYGTDPTDSSKKFYYTCPRYWCLLTNKMVTEKDILAGKCGPKVSKIEDAIIPKKAKTVPKGKYVYQFYDEKERNYPGFHKNNPSGLCIPCCYANWKTDVMKKRRDICQGKNDKGKGKEGKEGEEGDKEGDVEEKTLTKHTAEFENYVKGPEKYGHQLGDHRWGFLPISVEKLFQQSNADCQISKTNIALKFNHFCLLRHGIEVSTNQSFIACIASAMFYVEKNQKGVPSIKEMKEIIINTIDLDKFIKYQNGDLMTSFADDSIKVNLLDYKNTQLVKSIDKQKETKKQKEVKDFVVKVSQAFENFKKFLRDDTITIDYTYLWDLVCLPNDKLFSGGINLIILKIPENDTTNNIELVCPTNHYSVNTYDARKRSLILIKREEFFEPVYGYFNNEKHIHITKTFSEYDKTMSAELKSIFNKIVKPILGNKCRAFVSKPKEYRFKQSPLLDVLIKELIDKKYTIHFQVLNFQSKVIGLVVSQGQGTQGFIPCYPSSLTNLKRKDDTETEYKYVYMNDNLWKSYDETLDFMMKYYDYKEPSTNKKDQDKDQNECPYFCRVVEDELVTGFLTNTNQFVPIKTPVPINQVSDNIKTFTSNDVLIADINTLTNDKVDTERVQFIKKIQLETNFYNVFRNTLRILFNDYSNSKKRNEIRKECNKMDVLYNTKLDNVIKMLRKLVKDNNNPIVFIDYGQEGDDRDNSIDGDGKSDGQVKGPLIIPKRNLVNNTDNETYYFGKMADELIRYNRIKSFFFKPQSYLSFGQLKYNLRENEIIVLQELLNSDFFDNLNPVNINHYSKYNTYDNAEPISTQLYNPYFELEEEVEKGKKKRKKKIIIDSPKTEPEVEVEVEVEVEPEVEVVVEPEAVLKKKKKTKRVKIVANPQGKKTKKNIKYLEVDD